MVKIPNLDDLKKMGTGLIDSAKNVKFGEMMDKVKSGIDNVSGKGGVNVPQGDEAIKVLFEGLNTSVNELLAIQSQQVTVTRKIQSQLADLSRVIIAGQKAEVTDTQTTTPEQPAGQSEDTKKHE